MDAGDVAGNVGEDHAPGLGVVEGTAHRDVQAPLDDAGAQDIDAAIFEGGGGMARASKGASFVEPAAGETLRPLGPDDVIHGPQHL